MIVHIKDNKHSSFVINVAVVVGVHYCVAKVLTNYNCCNVYSVECLHFVSML